MSDYTEYHFNSSELSHTYKYLFPQIVKILPDKEKRILDLGCGNGSLAIKLLEIGYDVYGIDASEEGISIAKKNYPERFFLFDIYINDFPGQLANIKFDLIISTEVIEHIFSPGKFVELCKRILKKNDKSGEIILSTPYHGYLKNLALALSGKLDSHFTALWEGGHIKFWSKKTLTGLLEEYGFKVTEFYGAGRIPFLWKSMLIKAVLK